MDDERLKSEYESGRSRLVPLGRSNGRPLARPGAKIVGKFNWKVRLDFMIIAPLRSACVREVNIYRALVVETLTV